MEDPENVRRIAEQIKPTVGGVKPFSHIEAYQTLVRCADDIEQLSVYKKIYVDNEFRQLAIERLDEIHRLEEENTMLRKLVNEGRVV